MSELCEGCKLCTKGAKMVVFITGLCPNSCYYCPLGEVKGKDLVFANERPVFCDNDLISEAECMSALGAGITGGEPLMVIDRVIHYIKILKECFGPKFHIHLYTAKLDVSDDELILLEKAGLDELRIHPVNLSWDYKSLINRALLRSFSVGVEVPAIPGMSDELIKWAEYLKCVGADFLNLNELEFNEFNEQVIAKKFSPDYSSISSVNGSSKTALSVINKSDFKVHYCPANFKDSVQFRERLKRSALNIARSFDELTIDGTVITGIAVGEKSDLLSLKAGFFNEALNRLELSPKIAKRLSKKYSNIKFSLIEWLPTFDRPEVYRINL